MRPVRTHLARGLGILACTLAIAHPSATGEPAKQGRPPDADRAAPPRPAVPFPHPIITEVLYAVPGGPDGDANLDGVRDPLGDEFIELTNPHDRGIDVGGYVLTDASANPRSQLVFTFPPMRVPPKGVIVVFNGAKARISAPVGDAKAAPKALHPRFAHAAIFTINASGGRAGFSNAGDAVVLRGPDGKLIQRVRWGNADQVAGGVGFLLDELAPLSTKGSVQREGNTAGAQWLAHADIDGKACSPGRLAPIAAPPADAGAGGPAGGAGGAAGGGAGGAAAGRQPSPSPWPDDAKRPDPGTAAPTDATPAGPTPKDGPAD